ncbi:KH domain-containing protein HEN4 [Cicer arietinum]|uniref:KH domain-containing protein HEN4 isoform X1 n=1 Tax=Cicer arietinum TaxID=3827 RepID=A0A1S2YMF0_CICAR|nr:KH domain-containing protein HEN4 isoform X1 [Cicer arietinum]
MKQCVVFFETSSYDTMSNKRRYVPLTQNDTVFRILCSAANSDDLLTLASDGVKISIDDYAGDSSTTDDRIVVITGAAAEQPHEESAAKHALIRVFERMVEKGEESSKSLGCRLVAPSYQVGCVLGRGGKIVEKLRHESGAQIRVLPKDQSPLPPPGDEFIQITGNFNAVKKALLSVSSCLQDNAGNSGTFKSSGGAQVEPYPQRGPHPPDHHSRGYSSFPGSENVGPAHRMFVEEDVVFKMLCQQDKVGSLIGKGGSVVRALQNETGASIQIVDAGPDSDERVVVISALESSEQKHSPAQDAVIRVHSRLTEIGFEPSNAVVARLLVRSPQVGCLLGKGGHVISEMRRATGASIRIFSKEQIKYISHNEEVVQVIGTLHSVQDALFHITGRIRETIFPIKTPPPNFSVPPFPETPPPLFRPRNHMMSSGPPPPPHVGPPHGIDHPPGPPIPVDHQHAFSHGIGRGPPNMDRVPYPRGYEGPHSPRSWNSQAVNRGNPGTTADTFNLPSRNSTPGMNGNQSQNPNSSTFEITIPHMYLIHVYGENNSNLNQIQQISGANVVVHDPKPGATEGLVIVSGTQEQTHSAQCLIQGFILCGITTP